MLKNRIIIYKGTITIKGEFHSGSGKENVTDHPLIRNTSGDVILRGESFAGLIRQELVRQFKFQCQDYKNPEQQSKEGCNCDVCSFMGHSLIPNNKEQNNIYHASRLKVKGGKFLNAVSRIRHGVAIERCFQVAAPHKKHDKEALLDNAKVPFELELENPKDTEINAIEQILLEMKSGLLSLGGKKSAGFGNYEIIYEKYEFNLAKLEEVKKYLLRKFEKIQPLQDTFSNFKTDFLWETEKSKSSMPVISNSNKKMLNRYNGWRLSVPFNIWFPELFLINDPLEASLLGSDNVSVVDGDGKPWLPPSSIRGTFRSRAEQILRTLNEKSACDSSQDKNNNSLLFSCSAGIKKNIQKTDSNNQPSYKDLERDNYVCLGCQLFGSTFMASPIRFLSGTYKPGENHSSILTHFLAVCRFSGGGKDGAKFDALPLYDVHFQNCKIIIENFQPWQIGVIALTLKDFFQWDIKMGSSTRKGFGQVKYEFADNKEIILSTPENIYKTTKHDLCKDTGELENIKNWLQNCVGEFRTCVKNFKGVTYGN